MKITILFDILEHYQEKFPNQEVALAGKQGKEWQIYSLQKYIEAVTDLSYAVIELGIMPDDKFSIIANNLLEWNMLDMAIMQIGAITVSIYPTITEEADYLHILKS